MLIFETVSGLQEHLSNARSAGKKIGFVPTMGALHNGHVSLIEACKKENDITVCSIFVNPKQFNDQNDLANYPRDKEGDVHTLKKAQCDVLFYPNVDEIYPGGAQEEIDLGRIENVLEGYYRPGHFSGVSVVVKRLFEIVDPVNAYFGLKDYQQYAVIKALVRKLNLDVNIVGCETKREPSGLALSSRNRLLSDQGKKNALLIYDCLLKARKEIQNVNPTQLKSNILEIFAKNSFCKLEYFEIVDAETLEEVNDIKEHASVIACTAAYIEDIRLIDNLILIP